MMFSRCASRQRVQVLKEQLFGLQYDCHHNCCNHSWENGARFAVAISHRRRRVAAAATTAFRNYHSSSSAHNNSNGTIQPSPPQTALLKSSPISETPLDATVMEKPYTVVLMEDDASATLMRHDGDNFAAAAAAASAAAAAAASSSSSSGTLENQDTTTTANPSSAIPAASWTEAFSKIPREYGMSFGALSLTTRQNTSSNAAATTVAPIDDCLQALKDSDLPTIADAILVARGPVSSLVAQYYLESFSLKGLVLVDPILLSGDENETAHEESLQARIAELYAGDASSFERFVARRLKVEANAVPMLVVCTANAWESAATTVALRHSDPDGPYGRVPIVDLTVQHDNVSATTEETTRAARLLEQLDEWIDEALY